MRSRTWVWVTVVVILAVVAVGVGAALLRTSDTSSSTPSNTEPEPSPSASSASTPGVFELRQVLSEKPAGSQGVDCGAKPKSIKPHDRVTLCGRNGTQYALGPDALPPSPVDSAKAYQAPDGHWYVLVQFNVGAAKDLAKFTRSLYTLEPPINQAAIVINGVVVNATAINNAITTDSLVIPGPFTQEDAQALADSLGA